MGKSKIIKRMFAVMLSVVMILSIVNFPSIKSDAAGTKTVKKITVSNLLAKTLTLKKGKKFTLKTKVTVTGGASKAVIYKSSKPKIASVNKKGVITAKKKGKAVITITSKANSKKKLRITVTVGTPSTKVTIKGKSYVAVGKTTKLVATVTPNNASNKKVVWSSSNKRIATVSSKGIVKGRKNGTVTITAKAADGSGKKASFKVNVLEPIKISSISMQNMLSIKVVLQSPQKLSLSNFTVYNKILSQGTYNRRCVVDNIYTKDNKTYLLTLNTNYSIVENSFVKVAVKGLVGSASKETHYSYGKFTYNDETIYNLTLNQEFEDNFYIKNGMDYGYCTYTVKNFPAGIYYKVSDSGELLIIYGKPTKTGAFSSSILCKDEAGNIYNYTVKFNIGSDTKITASAYTEYYVSGKDGDCSINTKAIKATGGSRSYSYSITGTDYGLSIDNSGKLKGTLKNPGTFNINVKVTDVENSSIFTQVTVTIKVAEGYAVSGIVKDANGNPIPDGSVVFMNKDKASKYINSVSTYVSYSGAYSTYLPKGTYDVVAYYYGTTKQLFSQRIAGSKSGFDITFPLYKVSIYPNISDENLPEFGTWYDQNNRQVGYGYTLYLKAGTYKLHTDDRQTLLYDYSITLNITVNANTKSATATVTKKPSKSIKGSISANSSISISVSGNYVYYKFTPSVTGTYYFYVESSYDTYGALYNAEGKSLKTNDDDGQNSNYLISYNCTAGQTYYIGTRRYSDNSPISCTLNVSTTKPVFDK